MRSREEIMSELSYHKDRLEKLRALFDLTDDEEETEALIYEEKAAMLRYSRALREAKSAGITVFAGKEQ